MTTHLGATRFALPPPAAKFVRRGKVFLTAVAFVAAVLLVAAGSWPLKALVVLVFVRGLLASDVVAIRNAPRYRSRMHAPLTHPANINDTFPEPQWHGGPAAAGAMRQPETVRRPRPVLTAAG